ncbi:hypothetical protein L210DRAFT_3652926 [Boletus edulis BED1]|uniref:Uncharacterized protein n=1 Tax=Boletus edulis BED1 TaxID=1328754 RepID=A0AAD4G865_BOLED|nr:hypothetical protein L210DRAFT_3652926 [Boletus edulis BED1]
MRLLHLQPCGNNVNAAVSGQTIRQLFVLPRPIGLVGYPSRRMAERQLAEETRLELNTPKLAQAVRKFFSSAAAYAKGRLSARPSALPPLQVLNSLPWPKGVKFSMDDWQTLPSE